MCRAGSRIRWDDDVVWPVCWEDAALLEAWNALRELFGLARELGLLFDRSSWLMGWRSGVPGAQMNSLRAALRAALALEPVNGQTGRVAETGAFLCRKVRHFCSGRKKLAAGPPSGGYSG